MRAHSLGTITAQSNTSFNTDNKSVTEPSRASERRDDVRTLSHVSTGGAAREGGAALSPGEAP